MLLNKFKTAIEHTSQHKHIEMKEFNNTIYRSVAFLVTQPQEVIYKEKECIGLIICIDLS